jgi:hypothetical protein
MPLTFPLSPGPISGSLGQALDCEKAPVSTFPHIKPWGAQRTKINLVWSPENCSC